MPLNAANPTGTWPEGFGVLLQATDGSLRDRLWRGVSDMEEVFLNGDVERRVPHNLNVSFNFVEGESLIMAIKEIAVSSGSACTSASLEPSYVLRALGRSDELAHSSIRFTIGRFTTEADVDYAVDLLKRKVGKTLEVLVDEVRGTTAIGRGQADAPEIDGLVHVKGAKGAKPGDFLRVVVTGAADHDLQATVVPA